MQTEEPISRATLPNGQSVWVLTRYDDVRTMLMDPRFSADRRNPNYPTLAAGRLIPEGARTPLISMDPPEHGPARRAVLGEFTAKRLKALRPRIQEIVDEHIEAMLDGPRPADLVTALSLPVPSLVICELLGVPYTDHGFFQARTSLLSDRAASPELHAKALAELVAYLKDFVSAKQKAPADDLISRQLAKSDDPAAVTVLAQLLLSAGHETTANMISLGAMALLDRPDDLRIIRADPAKTPAAVEELLRYFTIGEVSGARVAIADVELGGVLIRAGEGVVPLLNTADRSPEAFDQPDKLDLERGARHHLAFGYGPHQCLGQNLARIELEIVFTTLFSKIPDLRLAAPIESLPFKNSGLAYGLHELPVTW
ncbi:cytochrome P450 [Amycolatopsis jiangsuensis]|uniref:Cytochrome P450 n=1 Tax=Amycolatopsis jiangsuensis TaxID=1181879 RepID=A0A840J6H9_9PSEU|nr:cytochrome P450 [Amycolatopsis jiangsuensis]MBB4689309.1 cytochrome P450 [Amycolatopsis jiangsuensis]